MSVAAIRMAAWRAANPEKAKAAQDRKNAARRKGSRPSTYQHSEMYEAEIARRQMLPDWLKAAIVNLSDARAAKVRASFSARNPGYAAKATARFYAAHPEARSVHVGRYRAKFGAVRAAGDLTEQQWIDRLNEFDHACAYCLRADVELTQEHIVPISLGGQHTIDNVIPACRSCNSTKKDRGILVMLPKKAA